MGVDAVAGGALGSSLIIERSPIGLSGKENGMIPFAFGIRGVV
jgi:hypothetical protein